MNIKQIKILFYALFAGDILAGIAVGFILNLFAGIVTSAVLFAINIPVYAIILKMHKISKGEQHGGTGTES